MTAATALQLPAVWLNMATSLADRMTEGVWSGHLDQFVQGAADDLPKLVRAASGSDLSRIKSYGRLVAQNLNTAERQRAGTAANDPYLPLLQAAADAGRRLAAATTVSDAQVVAQELISHVTALAKARSIVVDAAVIVVKDIVSANEKISDLFTERAIDLIRLEAGTRDKVWALLAHLEIDIVAAINKIDIRGVEASGHQRNRLSRLLDLVRASIKAKYRSASTLLARELREVADIEGIWTARAINAATHATWADSGVTRQFLATLATDVLIQGAPTAEWWGRQAGGLADRFADEMRRGVLLGENNSQLIDRVRGTGAQPGLMQVARNSAERLVRSSVQTVANAAREATYAANDDLIKALQWHATLDTRTSVYCITRDGHQYGIADHDAMDEGPPWLAGPGALHWNCRSTSVPVLKSWRELEVDADEIPKTTRASMDGQVAESLNFEAWLKKQSIARQDAVIGQGKADLWRAGKIKFRDLLDQSGRPLTTEELRAKAAKQANK